MDNMENIYNKYANSIKHYRFCITKDIGLAEDIMQETFVVAINQINKFRGDCEISVWLFSGRYRGGDERKSGSLFLSDAIVSACIFSLLCAESKMGEAGACCACGNVVCHRCSCSFVCDPARQFWKPFPDDHEISGNYANEQYPSEGKFFEAAGCLYDRHLVFYAVCTCDCVFVLCTGTGTETAEKRYA